MAKVMKIFLLLCLLCPVAIQSQVPSKVQGVTVTRTVQGSSPALRVSWSAVSGSGITYTVCYSTTSGTQSDPPSGANCGASGITGTSTTLGPLSGGTTYYIWVGAVSSGGRGPYSDREQVISYGVPSQVGPPVLTKAASSGRPALVVTWTAPSSERPITKYQVQCRIGYASWSTEDVTSTSTTLENLLYDAIYQIQVRAISDVGDGPFSDIRTISTYGFPSQVGPLVLTKAASSGKPALTVTWTAPDSDSPITKYQVQHRPNVIRWFTKNVTSTSTILENLSAGTRYYVRVRANSDVGGGPYSMEKSITTYQVPQQVTRVQFEVDTTNSDPTVTITWERPFSELPIIHYWVAIVENDTTQYLRRVDGDTSLRITLNFGKKYTATVMAMSAVGGGRWSERVRAELIREPYGKEVSPVSCTIDSGLPAGLFVVGLASGISITLLVVGIIWGACKLCQKKLKDTDVIYMGTDHVEMVDSPAYESANRIYDTVEMGNGNSIDNII